MPSHSAASSAAAWARLVIVLGSRVYRVVLLTLSAVALAPILWGWGSYVIESGSMKPSIDVGDVVIARPFETGEKVAVGRVYVFDDPSSSREHLLTHRIVELRDDGSYTSAGDANEVTDATPVTTADIEARGVVLAPFIGKPIVWMQAGEWVKLVGWLLLTVAAFWAASRNLDGEPPKWNLLRAARERTKRRRPSDDAHQAENGDTKTSTGAALRSRLVAVTAVLATAVLSTAVGTATASFTARTVAGSMSWTAGSWTQPYVSAVLADGPRNLWLLDEAAGKTTAQDRSGNAALGTYRSGATLGQQGGLPGNPGTSMRTSGGIALTSANPVGAPTTHSVELWFRTSSTTGGTLAGFGPTATSTAEDRTLRMTPGGQLSYGDWATSPVRILTTPRAYNDGAWHQVVVTTAFNSAFGQTTIYVDGAAVVAGSTSKTEVVGSGYWRFGGGPSAFTGFLDNVSIYDKSLTAARVAAHYAAR